MFEVKSYSREKEKGYKLLLKQLHVLVENEPNKIANVSNASALLSQFF